MFSKNLTVFLSLILFFALGLSLGYFLKGNKVVNKCASGNIISDDQSQVQNIKTNLTAGEAYAIAFSEARQWKSDAYLARIDLVSKKFEVSGAANGWKFTFYSKTKIKFYEVLVKDGESRGGEEKAPIDKKMPQTLKGDMVDSSVLAKSFYGTYSDNTEIVSLKMYYDSGSKKFIWTIFFPKGSHTIDAEN